MPLSPHKTTVCFSWSKPFRNRRSFAMGLCFSWRERALVSESTSLSSVRQSRQFTDTLNNLDNCFKDECLGFRTSVVQFPNVVFGIPNLSANSFLVEYPNSFRSCVMRSPKFIFITYANHSIRNKLHGINRKELKISECFQRPSKNAQKYALYK